MKKEKLTEIVNNIQSTTIETVFEFFEKTEDILLIKYDGVRPEKKFTIVIIGKESRFETIRNDSNDVKTCLRITLTEYLNYL